MVCLTENENVQAINVKVNKNETIWKFEIILRGRKALLE